VRAVLPTAKIAVYNDSVGALAAATMGRLFGIVLIAGTGMIAMGYSGRAGESAPQRAGGWGSFIDGGSGYAIGCDVIRAAIHGADGTGPATSLTAALLERLGLKAAEDLLGWVYSDPEKLGWAKFAAVAPIAFEAERKGDAVAKRIVATAAEALATCVRTTATKLKFTTEAVPVYGLSDDGRCRACALTHSLPVLCSVFAGGVVSSETPIGDLVWAEVRKFLPNAVRTRSELDAAAGAALLAWSGGKNY
jgi:hypothetical protein